MSIKSLFRGALVACLMLVPVTAFGSTSTAASTDTVTVSVTVDSFAEWASTTAAIGTGDWDHHVNSTTAASSASVALTLYTNVSVTLKATTGDATNGILTQGTQTIVTTYEVTGAVDTADSAYRPADASGTGMFNAGTSWTCTHAAQSDPYSFIINFNVQAVAPAGINAEPGTYSTTIILTASWS